MEYDVDSRLTWIWVTRSLRGSRGVRAHVIEEGACPYKRVNEMPRILDTSKNTGHCFGPTGCKRKRLLPFAIRCAFHLLPRIS